MCVYCNDMGKDKIIVDICLNCVPTEVFCCTEGWSIVSVIWGRHGTYCGDYRISKKQWSDVCKKRAKYLFTS